MATARMARCAPFPGVAWMGDPAELPMHAFGPETVIATFRVRADQEGAFQALLDRHWTTLHRLGLTNGEPSLVFRGKDRAGLPFFVEIFTWKDAKAPETAHHAPEVEAIWGAMEPLVEDRKGQPKWEFPHVAPVAMAHGGR